MNGLRRIFSIPELKKRIVYTLSLLFACRLGAYVPVPGIDGDAAVGVFRAATGGTQNLFQLMDVFSGGAFAHMTVVALGVMPYISASIIMQLLMAMVPALQREVKEHHEAGRKKMGRWTRTLTLVLACLQAALFAKYAIQLHAGASGIIVEEMLIPQILGIPWLFFAMVICTMTAGTILLMWIGEQITAKGLGNGVSLIIAMGILSSLPTTLGSVLKQLHLDSQTPGRLTFSSLVVLSAVFVLIIVGTILIIQAQKKIPLEYARRTVGRAGADSPYLPLKVNYAGVIPVIFASSLLMFPATLGQFAGSGSWLGQVAAWLSPGNWAYLLLYVGLIIFFTYFWTATQFHPEQIASDMKRNGAFVPGIRQGKPTEDYLDRVMNRITFVGAVFLALIAVLPTLVGKVLDVDASITYFFGGTSLLILVGVVLDTMKQMESHLLMKRYDGFMKRGRLS